MRHWNVIKASLSFRTVTQDGDDEGVMRLDALPTPDQATSISKALSIRRIRQDSKAALEALRRRASKWRFRAQGAAKKGHAGVRVPEEVE